MDIGEDGASDIGTLWRQALDDYAKESGVDLRSADQIKWNITTITKDQDQEISAFSKFRHNKGKMDKIRSCFARNAEIIEAVAGQVAGAASAAFPPASAILTAFTYVMSAAKGVSDDYDMIESFFDIMNGFLERLSLLEKKLPKESVYQTMLIRVFAAILNLSAIARSYRKHGRFSKWAKSLIDHQDPKLKGAYDLLQKHLSRLESMTLMATLRQTMVISKDLSAVGTAVNALGTKVDFTVTLAQQNIVLGQQNLSLGQQNLSLGLDTRAHAEQAALAAQANKELSEEALLIIKEQQEDFKTFARRIQEQAGRKAERGAAKGDAKASDRHDSGAKKAAALTKLKNELDCQPYLNALYEQEVDYKAAFVKGTLDWIEQEDGYNDILDEKSKLLWICGEPGMGKSTLSLSIAERLELQFSDDQTTSICQFFVREDYDRLRSLSEIIKACALQVALKDTSYRDHVLSDLQRDSLTTDDPLVVFNRLFIQRFPKDSDRRTVIILDGADEIHEDDVDPLKELIFMMTSSDANVQIIFTSDQSFLPESIKSKENALKRIDLDKERIRKDMWKIALARTKTLTRLRKLRPEIRKKIASRLRQKADNLRYIEHMARRLNALGAREGPILKELDRLPENTEKLYETLLEECQRHRTPEELSTLRVFFAWLAYAKRQISLGEANKLIEIIATESGISIDEELDGKSSRLLRLANSSAFEEQDSESSELDAEDREEEKEDQQTEAQEDLSVLLGFQERSLRAYFKDGLSNKNGLRSSASTAHTMILETISKIYMGLKDDPYTMAELDLLTYCGQNWKNHMFEINLDELSDDEARKVIENVYMILDNKNNALKKIQLWNTGWSTTPSILGNDDVTSEKTLSAIQQWAYRAIRLPSLGGQFSTIQEWFRPLAQDPARIYIRNARSHIINWFQTSAWQYQAGDSFRYAHEALRKGHLKNLPELRQNQQLSDHFNNFEVENANKGYDEKAILAIAGAFWDVPKSYRAFWAIAMTMKFEKLYLPATAQIKLGLELTTDDAERFNLYTSIGDCLVQLNMSEQDVDKKASYLNEAVEFFEKGRAINNADSLTTDDPRDTRIHCGNMYMGLALAEFLRGNIDAMTKLVSDAVRIPETSLRVYELLDPVLEAGDTSAALIVLKTVKRVDLTWYLKDLTEKVHQSLQETACKAGEPQTIVDMYTEVVRFLDQTNSGSEIRLYWADFHSKVRNELTRAKELLYQSLSLTPVYYGYNSQVSEATWRIVDILVEEFRLTNNPKTKTGVLDELKSLLSRYKDTLGDDYDPWQSQTAIPLALMTRTLGPAVEYANILGAIFDGCIEGLSDDTSWNDAKSFRTLARVLSCVEGLEEQAEIASTLQMYIVDKDVFDRENSPKADEEGEGPEKVENKQDSPKEDSSSDSTSPASSTTGAGSASVSSESTTITVPTTEETDSPKDGAIDTDGPPDTLPSIEQVVADAGEKDSIKGAETEKNVLESDEDISDSWLFCNDCGNQISNWKGPGVYLCLYCTDMDLCKDCFEKRRKQETGELPAPWRVLCPKGHKHIKAPVDGWEGMKDGRFMIKGEKIIFKEWLNELKNDKWPKAWTAFWSKEIV